MYAQSTYKHTRTHTHHRSNTAGPLPFQNIHSHLQCHTYKHISCFFFVAFIRSSDRKNAWKRQGTSKLSPKISRKFWDSFQKKHEKSRKQENTLETLKISDEENENLRNVGKGGRWRGWRGGGSVNSMFRGYAQERGTQRGVKNRSKKRTTI